jgi:hypothetical protein
MKQTIQIIPKNIYQDNKFRVFALSSGKGAFLAYGKSDPGFAVTSAMLQSPIIPKSQTIIRIKVKKKKAT